MLVKPNVVLVGDTGSVLYNVDSSGVYIQHIDGTLYTTDKWTAGGFTSDLANGVAVVDTACSFVIAKEDAYDNIDWGSDRSSAISGVMLTGDGGIAKTDYAGAINTELIAATSGAAYQCANYAFPNGATGYLPALGEWAVAYKNKTAIDAAMTLIGGTAILEDTYWSSTQHSAKQAWTLYWRYGGTSYSQKNSYQCVRAFCSL